jgi:hypothetical protein
VIVHGSGGVQPGEWEWAKRLNALGIASIVIDNFTGRSVGETETDPFRPSPTADITGALAALRLLATHPGIDPKRIGFSLRGIVALDTALEPLRHGIIDGDLASPPILGINADHMRFLSALGGNCGRNAATILSLKHSSSR